MNEEFSRVVDTLELIRVLASASVVTITVGFSIPDPIVTVTFETGDDSVQYNLDAE